jgi:large subunit ribosomal protein L6
MSRVGKMPITVPQGVDVAIAADQITVKGSTGHADAQAAPAGEL